MAVGLVLAVGALVAANVAVAAQAQVGLGTAGSFAVLAGAGVTNTGPSVITGDLGTCPTPAITGFPPGVVLGTQHAADAVACGAQSDLVTAYNDAAGRAPTTTFGGPTDLGGFTVVSGVYTTPTSFAITGTLTLDGQGDPNAVFIFQAGSTVITAPNSTVSLINGTQACNVFWQVGSSATIGVGSTFIGSVLALTSITANTNANIQGRLLARNGATTLDSNVITAPFCAAAVTTTTATTTLPGATTSTTVTGATTTTTSPTATTVGPTATTLVPTATTVNPTSTTTAVGGTPTTLGSSAAVTTSTASVVNGAAVTTTTGAGAANSGGTTGTTVPAGTSTETARSFGSTGADVGWMALVGGLALFFGGAIVLGSRKSLPPE
jgi:hypothetical protein